MKYAAALFALLGYAILTTWVRQPWAWAVFQAGVFGLAAAWTADALRKGRPIRGTFLLVPVALAVLLGISEIMGHRTMYAWATWKSVLTWTTWLAVLYLAVQILEDGYVRRRFLCGLAVFGGILSVEATVEMFFAGGKIFWFFDSGYSDFVMGPFPNRDQYAAFVELLLPIALIACLQDRRRWLGWCAMAGGMFASVVAAASRAGAVIATLEIVAVLSIAALRGRMWAQTAGRIAGTFAGLAAVFTIVVGGDVLWNRMCAPDPFAGRREMVISSLHMIEERPWGGFGLGTWAISYPRFALYDDGTYVNQAHNDWVQWTAEGGAPLLALVLALTIALVRPAVSSLWGMGVLGVLMHAFVDYPFQQRPALGAWFFVVAGALAARASPRQRIE